MRISEVSEQCQLSPLDGPTHRGGDVERRSVQTPLCLNMGKDKH